MSDVRTKIKNKASHLTEEQLCEIMILYYDLNTTMKEITEKYPLPGVSLNQLHYIFPSYELPDTICPYCESTMYSYMEKRNKSPNENTAHPYCLVCGHENSPYCSCFSCKEQKNAKEKETLETTNMMLLSILDTRRYPPVVYEELTIKEKVFLGAFLRAGTSSDFDIIHPISQYQGKLFPTEEFLKIAFDELYAKDIILIHPSAKRSHFTITIEANQFSFNWKEVPFYFNLVSPIKNRDEIIAELLNPGEWSEITTEDTVELWKLILYWECIDLFSYRMKAFGFSYTIGKDTTSFFENIITLFPISQIYSIIWNASKNAIAYYVESKVPKNQASNSVLSRMRNASDKIFSGQWNKYDYSRPYDCPQSLISEYFFNSVLKICDQCWEIKPYILVKKDVSIPPTSEEGENHE